MLENLAGWIGPRGPVARR